MRRSRCGPGPKQWRHPFRVCGAIIRSGSLPLVFVRQAGEHGATDDVAARRGAGPWLGTRDIKLYRLMGRASL